MRKLSYIEAFGAKIRGGLDLAAFYATRQIIELLDIRGKIAREHGEKVIYLVCLPAPIQYAEFSEPKLTQTFYMHEVKTMELTARLVLGQGAASLNLLSTQAMKAKSLV